MYTVYKHTAPNNFNPRSPCGERPLPARFICPSFDFNPRSPCGERLRWRQHSDVAIDFNPRSPCGERLLVVSKTVFAWIFQSTLPVRGATGVGGHGEHAGDISIHAPRAGSDPTPGARTNPCWDFNPRSPCGERHQAFAVMCVSGSFQSTLPVRGATLELRGEGRVA